MWNVGRHLFHVPHAPRPSPCPPMTASAPAAGECPFCGAELQPAPVLIKYEIDGDERQFVECPGCDEPVRPDQ